MGQIIMDSQGLAMNAESLKANAESYTTQLNRIKETVESLRPYWTDAAGQEFFAKFDEKYNVIKEMGPAIDALGVAVERTNARMNEAVDSSISAFR